MLVWLSEKLGRLYCALFGCTLVPYSILRREPWWYCDRCGRWTEKPKQGDA